jgi:superfamily II DNA or RNA helicase
MVNLYEHQKLGKEYLLKHYKACLFFEVGTGKTFTALSALTELSTAYKILIIAPKRVLEHV